MARELLRSVRHQEEVGRPAYLSELRDELGKDFALDPSELLQLLEKFGYVVIDRANGVVCGTRDGRLAAAGDKLADLAGDLMHQYEGRVAGSEKKEPRRHVVLDGRYRRYGVIGAGAIATAYRGEVLTTRREVVIKELKEVFAYFTAAEKVDIVRRLEQVVNRHARITHPNVNGVIDQNVKAEHPYYVSELAHGGSLRRLVGREDPVPANLVASYFVQICHGLKCAHSLDVVHRSLKPENVLLDVHGNARLSDFGLSSILDRPPGQAGHVFVDRGSVGYMAPELFRDPSLADTRTDIYALGIILYELCTGRLPGRRSPMPSEVRKDLPKGLDEIFDRMTQDDPDERYPLVEAILDDFYSVEKIDSVLDRRSAILMPRGPFSELDLPEVDEAVEGAASAPEPAGADGGPTSPGVSEPASATFDGESDAFEGTGESFADDGTSIESGPTVTTSPDLPQGSGGDFEVVVDDPPAGYGSGDAERQSERPSQPPASDPVMPRRRFGVPPRRK